MSKNTNLSLNKLTAPLVENLIVNAESLRLDISNLNDGTRIIDAGINAIGGIEAGRLIAEICMGGLGVVKLRASTNFHHWSWHVDVHSSNPVMACLASQYAGWSLSHGEGKDAFHALGSGPARTSGSNEPLFDELKYHDSTSKTCIVIEVDRIPPVELTSKIAKMCNVQNNELTVILTPTSSLAGTVQIISRVLETSLHKAHELHFPLENIIDGAGSAPLCPPSNDFLTAMSRTNDSILFAGQIQLFVEATDEDAEELANALPSSTSKDYGKPFGEIFKDVNYDFYKIDPMLFSPAKVSVSSLTTGHTFHAGKIDLDLLDKSYS
ncbi:MAG: methenyltetrahydromethanopterin cyclohydrolase [Legionellales bacterium]|nr:methenyltetrahydromethanopterin cyclohydrolase [Legionellales bacterium]